MISAERFRENAIKNFRRAKNVADIHRELQKSPVISDPKTMSNLVEVHNSFDISVLKNLIELGLSEDQLAYLYAEGELNYVSLITSRLEDLIKSGIEEEKAKLVKEKYPYPPTFPPTYASW